MTSTMHYSPSRVRRSLRHFFAGKILSGIIGVIYLILLVRHMRASDYGSYIALIALTELFYLSTGFGLSTIAQRYVTEYRMHASAQGFHRFLKKLLYRRFLMSILFSFAVLLFQHWILKLLGIESTAASIALVVVLLIATASVFFLEEVLGALLLQGVSQSLGVARNVMKLSALCWFIYATGTVTIDQVLLQECVIALILLVAGHGILYARLAHSETAQLTSPDHRAEKDDYVNSGMADTARRFYAVQLVGQIYAPSASKLIVTRILGLGHTAAFGFAQSIADILRNYLPAHLLAGWLRPIMVSRYLARRNVNDLGDIANLVVKLNLLGIVPLAVFFLLRGDAFADWMTAGRYTQVGTLLVLLTLMVGLQTVHLMFTMITITIEQASANLTATLLAAASLPLTVCLIYWLGVEGAAWGLLGSEVIWLLAASRLLARRGWRIEWDLRGTVRIWLAGAVAGVALWLTEFNEPQPSHLGGSAVLVVAIFLLCSVLLKPLRDQERALARGILPQRLVLW